MAEILVLVLCACRPPLRIGRFFCCRQEARCPLGASPEIVCVSAFHRFHCSSHCSCIVFPLFLHPRVFPREFKGLHCKFVLSPIADRLYFFLNFFGANEVAKSVACATALEANRRGHSRHRGPVSPPYFFNALFREQDEEEARKVGKPAPRRRGSRGNTCRVANRARRPHQSMSPPRRRAGSSGGSRAGANGARSTWLAPPSRMSSLIASPVAGALSMPHTLWPVAT